MKARTKSARLKQKRVELKTEDDNPELGKPWIDRSAMSLSKPSVVNLPYSPQDSKRIELRNMLHCNRGSYKAAWRDCGKKHPFDAIYIIKMGETDAYKIGFSVDAKARLAELQVSSPLGLSMSGFVSFLNPEILASAEYEAHILASRYGRHLRGEWFQLPALAITRIVDELAEQFKDDVFGVFG